MAAILGRFTFGLASCVVCHHEWDAVIPADSINGGLECPECHKMTGEISDVVTMTITGEKRGNTILMRAAVENPPVENPEAAPLWWPLDIEGRAK